MAQPSRLAAGAGARYHDGPDGARPHRRGRRGPATGCGMVGSAGEHTARSMSQPVAGLTETASIASAPARRIVDVWSRTEPKYRLRAYILLLVNLVLFSVLCAFTFWLRTARVLDFRLESYIEPARFWETQAPSLTSYVLTPIDLQRTPVHGAVLGLLLAAIVAVPIVTSILYRLGCGLLFVLCVLIFAHMPWMSVTLLLSCALACLPPFRMNFRFASALLGMLPVLLYLLLATRGTADQLGPYAAPTHKQLLAAPWVLAILAACGMMGLVLVIARIVNYRPGAVSPVVALALVVPMVLFHTRVGVDELTYRILEQEYGPGSQRFAPLVDPRARIQAQIHRSTARDAPVDPYQEALFEALGGRTEPLRRRIFHLLLTEFLADRAAADEACRRFLADHPTSRYVPCALYIQGRALDARLDERRLADSPPTRELYSDFPHPQSESCWRVLLESYPDNPLATAAGLRLAQLRWRRGEIDEALKVLETVLSRARQHLTRAAAAAPTGGLLRRALPESSLGYDPSLHLFEARRLQELLLANRHDPRYGDEPLVELARLDPRRPRYVEQLMRLDARYPQAQLHDNILVLAATARPDGALRAAALEGLLATLPDGDARAEAMFRLADWEMQSPEADARRRQEGLVRMQEVAHRYAETCWGAAAAQRIALVRQAPGPLAAERSAGPPDASAP